MPLVNATSYRLPFADRSFHMCVTSPPYLWKRLYDAPHAIWDDPGGCEHAWASYGESESGMAFCSQCNAWLGQHGQEPSDDLYIQHAGAVFDEVKRVLRDDGTLWLNLGDTWAGGGGSGGDYNEGGLREGQPRPPGGKRQTRLPRTSMMLIPARVAIELQRRGWLLRMEIIWQKSNPMPDSVTNRPSYAHEQIFLFSKSHDYFYDQDAIRVPYTEASIERSRYPINGLGTSGQAGVKNGRSTDGTKMVEFKNPEGRNEWSVWEIAKTGYGGEHYATYPTEIPKRCIKAGTSEKGVCPTCGAPWKRDLERVPRGDQNPHKGADRPIKGNKKGNKGNSVKGNSVSIPSGQAPHKFKDWIATCDHFTQPPVPALVLDPFAGSGTTIMVARQLGRLGVGVDISGTYLEREALSRGDFKTAPSKLAELPLFSIPD